MHKRNFMFDLGQSIANWRKEMIAAGIKPESLDELESHLRKEMEHQMKVGLNTLEGFQASISNVGQGRVLQNEFNKVDTGRRVKSASFLALGWLIAILMLLHGATRLDYFDFFSYHPVYGGHFQYAA